MAGRVTNDGQFEEATHRVNALRTGSEGTRMFELPVIQPPLRLPSNKTANQTSPVHSLCENCGECCRHVGCPPFLPGDTDFDDLPPNLRADVLASRRRPASDRECDWFDPQTKRCRHYDLRPILCREFGVDSKACQATRKLALGRLAHNSESGVAERVACVGETSRGAATADRTSAPGPSPHGTPIAVFMVWRRLRPLRILDDR